jgi:hypothetical protein
MIGNGPEGGLDSGLLAGVRWTDKSFALTRDRQGVAQKPDFDFIELGLLFPQADPTEEIYVIDQMDHRKKLGTNLRLHVHFIQGEVAIPNFVCEYRWYNNGQSPSAGFVSVETDNGAGPIFTYPGSGLMLQIIQFPEISFPIGNEGLSANFEFKMYRDDNRVTGDVLTKYVDYHYQMDSDGSREEFIK